MFISLFTHFLREGRSPKQCSAAPPRDFQPTVLAVQCEGLRILGHHCGTQGPPGPVFYDAQELDGTRDQIWIHYMSFLSGSHLLSGLNIP